MTIYHLKVKFQSILRKTIVHFYNTIHMHQYRPEIIFLRVEKKFLFPYYDRNILNIFPK